MICGGVEVPALPLEHGGIAELPRLPPRPPGLSGGCGARERETRERARGRLLDRPSRQERPSACPSWRRSPSFSSLTERGLEHRPGSRLPHLGRPCWPRRGTRIWRMSGRSPTAREELQALAVAGRRPLGLAVDGERAAERPQTQLLEALDHRPNSGQGAARATKHLRPASRTTQNASSHVAS